MGNTLHFSIDGWPAQEHIKTKAQGQRVSLDLCFRFAWGRKTSWYGLGKKDLAILPESLPPSVRIVDSLQEVFRPEELHLETFNRNGENMIVGSYTNTTGSDVSFACIATEWRSVHQYAYDGEVLGYQPWLKAGETFYFAESIDDWSGPCILSVQTRKPKPENYEGFSEELSRREDGSFTFTVDFAFGPLVPAGCGHASIVLLFYDENDTLVWVDKHICRDPGTYTFDAPPCEYASYRSSCALEAIIYLASTIDFF